MLGDCLQWLFLYIDHTKELQFHTSVQVKATKPPQNNPEMQLRKQHNSFAIVLYQHPLF